MTGPKIERYRRGNSEELRCSFRLTECHQAPSADDPNAVESDVAARFSGIASIFDQQFDAWVPSMGCVMPTVVHPGAFTKTIQEQSASKVKILCQHRNDLLPIGCATTLAEGREGLLISAFVVDTELGDDVAKLMRTGVLTELSIGATPIKYDFEEVDGQQVRHVREYMLHEVSVVDEGANPGSRVTELMRKQDEARLWSDLLARIQSDDEAAVRIAVGAFADLNAGRVLSSKNVSLITTAIEALKSLLDAAEPQAKPPALTAEVEASLEAQLALLDRRIAAITGGN